MLDTKAGPPAAAKDNGSSYHQQDAVPQLGKIQLALGRYQRIGAGMPMVAVVLDAEPVSYTHLDVYKRQESVL